MTLVPKATTFGMSWGSCPRLERLDSREIRKKSSIYEKVDYGSSWGNIWKITKIYL
jgi:hypothetical protein